MQQDDYPEFSTVVAQNFNTCVSHLFQLLTNNAQSTTGYVSTTFELTIVYLSSRIIR